MSTQVKTPDEVAALARQLWALHREGHEDVIQLYLSELVDRLRKDKPIVLVDRQELTDLRAGIDRIEGAIGALRANGSTMTAAPSITPKAAEVRAIVTGDWVTHPSKGSGRVTEIEGQKALVRFGDGDPVRCWNLTLTLDEGDHLHGKISAKVYLQGEK